MALVNSEGVPFTKASLTAASTAQDAPRVLNEDVYETFTYPGAKFESTRRLRFPAGQLLQKSQFDELFKPASVTSVTPTTGPAVGGTVVTIKGTGLSGASGVTFGGTAGTAFSVVSDTEIKVTSPAKTAGAQAVVVKDDNADVAAGNFTYTA